MLLRLPIGGLSLGQPVGVSLLTRALAAAVIGRMEKLPRTLVAALALGVIEQAVLFETGKTIVVDAVLFAVILVALVVQHGGAERAEELGFGSVVPGRSGAPGAEGTSLAARVAGRRHRCSGSRPRCC